MSDLLNSASLVMIPSGYKEDTVFSQIPTDGSGDLSFTRASNGTRINSAGLVEVCPWNLVPNSEVFALWNTVLIGGSTITVTDNFVTAPNGTLTGAKVVFSTFSDFAQLFQFYSLAPTQNLTATLYAKVPSGTRVCNFGFYDGAFKNQQKTLTTEWQRIEYTGSIDAGTIRACWFYGDGGASNVEVHLWGGQLNVGSTAKPYFPTTDRLNVPRLTYQNGGGGCPSLLLEKQSTNVILYSEQFDDASWTKNVSVTANAIISPDGTQNADKILESASNVQQWAYQSPVMVGAQTATIYAKKGERNYIAMATAGLDPSFFNLDTGVVVSTASGATASITSVGNGWYRCSVSSPSIVGGTFFIVWISYDGVNRSYAGDTSKGVYVWGAQNEASSYATSYIGPTTSASATRVADACFKTGISSLIGQTEGTLFLDFVWNGHFTTYQSIEIFGNSNNRIGVYTYDSLNTIRWFIVGSGSVPFEQNISSALVIGQRYKMAIAYKSGDSISYINGSQTFASSATFSFNNALNDFYFQLGSGVDPFYQPVSQTILFPTRLTNAELASLTTI